MIFRNCDAIQQHSSLPVGNGGGFYNYRPDGAGITTEATLDSCTFHLNTSDQAGSLASVDGSTIKASNSLFWDGNPSVSVGGSTDVFRYCSSGNALPGNDHNDTNNPLLNADSTLTCGSLAINSGKRELLPSDDFDLDNSGNPPGHYEELPLDFALQQRVVVEVDRGAMELPRPPCLSDISGNGVVDVDDLIAVINNWGCGQPIVPCPADINGPCPNQGDGLVDVNDLLLVINYWDTNCGSGSTGEGLPQSYTDCSNLCAQYSGQAWADCMQACFKILCERGQTEYCED